ncbi:unnamed protein product [Lactuca virosa]|uniref:Uncharacterized protein n=1 Tax=Lactuca virosa TaxID=75947 RepID=A0AAU9NMN1_9ASTR|nr:unnamed protein product [Lactuca virosa]
MSVRSFYRKGVSRPMTMRVKEHCFNVEEAQLLECWSKSTGMQSLWSVDQAWNRSEIGGDKRKLKSATAHQLHVSYGSEIVFQDITTSDTTEPRAGLHSDSLEHRASIATQLAVERMLASKGEIWRNPTIVLLVNQGPDQETTLTAVAEYIFSAATNQPFRFPSNFTFLLIKKFLGDKALEYFKYGSLAMEG